MTKKIFFLTLFLLLVVNTMARAEISNERISIGGVKIGDNIQKVIKIFGEPKNIIKKIHHNSETKKEYEFKNLYYNNKRLNLYRRKKFMAKQKIIKTEHFGIQRKIVRGIGMYRHDNPVLNRVLRKLAKDIGIESLSMHTLRHTFVTRCIESGMRPKTLQKILGHSTLDLTMNLYVHVTDETLNEEMKKFESLALWA